MWKTNIPSTRNNWDCSYREIDQTRQRETLEKHAQGKVKSNPKKETLQLWSLLEMFLKESPMRIIGIYLR